MTKAEIEQSLTDYFADFTHSLVKGGLRYHVKLDETLHRWHIVVNFDVVAGHEVSVANHFALDTIADHWLAALRRIDEGIKAAIAYEENR